jgi:predicted phosphohydrolase
MSEKSRESAESFILQTNYGIIPFDLWDSADEGVDPAESYSSDPRIAKRKYRKLKRKALPKNKQSFRNGIRARYVRKKINRYLKNRELK